MLSPTTYTLFYWTLSDGFWGQWIVNTVNWYVLFSHSSYFPPCWEQLWDKSIAHGFFHYLEVCVRWSVKYVRKCIMYGFPCEMDFSPLVTESHPRHRRLGLNSETRGEKTPSHMETIQNVYRQIWKLVSF